jgi:hypothetical protein
MAEMSRLSYRTESSTTLLSHERLCTITMISFVSRLPSSSSSLSPMMSGRYVRFVCPSPPVLHIVALHLWATLPLYSEASIDLQVLDGLLTYSRLNDPTFAHGDGPPPTHLKLGKEGKADVKDGGNDQIIAELNERVSPLTLFFCLELTCRYSLLLDRPTMSFSSRVSRVLSRMSCRLPLLASQRGCRVLREYFPSPVDLN